MIIPQWILEIRKLREAATKGPWYPMINSGKSSINTEICFAEIGIINGTSVEALFGGRVYCSENVLKNYENDMDFIAASPTNQAKLEAALLIALEALEKIIKKDKYEALFPQGPAIAEEALNKIQSLGEK